MMSVATASKNVRSCDTTSRVHGQFYKQKQTPHVLTAITADMTQLYLGNTFVYYKEIEKLHCH